LTYHSKLIDEDSAIFSVGVEEITTAVYATTKLFIRPNKWSAASGRCDDLDWKANVLRVDYGYYW
jgi:hypothetical protein